MMSFIIVTPTLATSHDSRWGEHGHDSVTLTLWPSQSRSFVGLLLRHNLSVQVL